MNTSIKIERIKTDPFTGWKLIAFSKVTEYPKCKPQVSPCEFADYKANELTVYWRSEKRSFTMPNFKAALKFLRTSNFNIFN